MKSGVFLLLRSGAILAGVLAIMTNLTGVSHAAGNWLAEKPPMGWSSWSFIRQRPSEATIKAQAIAMHLNLQSHGFEYLNLDDFWYLDPRATIDEYGRWICDPDAFPHGIAALSAYVHSLGLKFGIYVTPGIPVAAYNQNTPIEATKYHARDIADPSRFETNYNFGLKAMYDIDYRKPGARQFIYSWARLFASWGVDYLKVDGVGVADIEDVEVWSEALKLTGRPIHLALSNSLNLNYGDTWRRNANSWRISGDVEAYLGTSSYPLTDWKKVLSHFQLASQWTHFAGPGGWNDLDSLELGNGSDDGTNGGNSRENRFTENQRQSLMSYWCIAAAPLLLGTDLTANLDSYDYQLLRNDEIIAIDQAGLPGAPVIDYLNSDPDGNTPEIWRSKQPDGTYAVVLTNPSGTAQNGRLDWTIFGVLGDVIIRDLWSNSNLLAHVGLPAGYKFSSPVTVALEPYQSKFFKIIPLNPVAQYLANAETNRVSKSTALVPRNSATDRLAVSFVGNGGSMTFESVFAPKAGTYSVGFIYFNSEANRLVNIQVNGDPAVTVTFPKTGPFSSLGTLTQQLSLVQGDNRITISAPGNTYPPDIDSMVIAAQTRQYLADAAQLSGPTIKITSSSSCTNGYCVTGIDKANTLTFTDVMAAQSGVHSILILYLSHGTRSANLTVNGGGTFHVEFPSTSPSPKDDFVDSVVGAVVVRLSLLEGANTITISEAKGSTPDLDSIIVAD
jgi:alpha galactosidase A-like protein/alpha-galactosidase-like CBM13-containing protein/alpha galactosidase C-like protein